MALTTARARLLAVVSVCLIGAAYSQSASRPAQRCTVASSTDTLVGMTQLMGNKNTSDSLWHDEVPYFRQHGPISKFTLYRAFFYDGIWHDPGELKGMQFWYGPKQQPPIYTYYDGDANLFGARKPHLPQEFSLEEGELITRVELQWDPISMRHAVFNTNKGRTLSWGFPNVAGATKAVAEAPVPGAYVAAIRGFEGKPAPVSKKRYIIQVSVVWAVPSCKPPGASPGGVIPLESSRVASKQTAAGPTNIYMFDKETVELIPQGIEGANVIYDGVTITKPAESEGTPAPTIPVASSSSSSSGQQAAVAVPTIPVAQPVKRVQEESGPAEKPAATSQQPQAAAKQTVAQQGAGGDAQAPVSKDAYEHMSVHRDHAAARKSVHVLPPGAIGPQLPQQLSEISDEGEVIASTREPAQKPAVPRQPTAQQQQQQEPVPQQQQQQQQQQRDPWTAVWSTLLG